MKKIAVCLFLSIFTLNAYAEDLVMCYLYQVTTYQKGNESFSNEQTVNGSHLLFDPDDSGMERIVVIEGVKYRLLVTLRFKSNVIADRALIYLEFAVFSDSRKVWNLLGRIAIDDDDLFNMKNNIIPDIIKTESYLQSAPNNSEGDGNKVIKVQAICETVSEREAIIKIFNETHSNFQLLRKD